MLITERYQREVERVHVQMKGESSDLTGRQIKEVIKDVFDLSLLPFVVDQPSRDQRKRKTLKTLTKTCERQRIEMAIL